MEHHENFLSLWDLVKFKYGTYIYHWIASVMRINNILYLGVYDKQGPLPGGVKKWNITKFSKSLGLSQISCIADPHVLRESKKVMLDKRPSGPLV